jgi:DNA-binding MarR family transcriptional regulator
MVIYIDEERAYFHWVTHHRQGFVLAGRFRPNWGHLVLHRATCQEVKTAKTRRTHWTTGSRFKACALQRDALLHWAETDLGCSCDRCPECTPDVDGLDSQGDRPRRTRLATDILEYVLEAAVIHFDEETPPYHLTVAMIADCMGKTPAQVSPALRRLADDGYLEYASRSAAGKSIRPRSIVYPTVLALRTLSECANQTDAELLAELAKIRLG